MDQFFTNKDIAKSLFQKTLEILNIKEENYVFLEPSAGEGSFSSLPTNCIAYDLEPMAENIQNANFLELELYHDNLITIGNPPFGKRAKLAVDFFNKCAKYSNVIAMIFPNQFNKYNTQSQLDERFKLIYKKSLDDDIFYFEDKKFNGIRCTFQIWIKENSEFDKFENLRILNRPKIKLKDVKLWQHNATAGSMGTVEEDWEYAVYRQGYKDYNILFTKKDYDFIKERMLTSSDQFFFMKPLTKEAEEIIKKIDFDELAKQNTTTKGFGKADFCIEYERKRREI